MMVFNWKRHLRSNIKQFLSNNKTLFRKMHKKKKKFTGGTLKSILYVFISRLDKLNDKIPIIYSYHCQQGNLKFHSP